MQLYNVIKPELMETEYWDYVNVIKLVIRVKIMKV